MRLPAHCFYATPGCQRPYSSGKRPGNDHLSTHPRQPDRGKGAPRCGIDHTYTYIYIIVGIGRRPGGAPRLHDKREWGTPAMKRNAGAGIPRLHNRPTAPGGPPCSPQQRMSHKATQRHGPTGAATPRPAHAANSRSPGPSMQVKALAVGLSPVYKRLFHVLYQLHGV